VNVEIKDQSKQWMHTRSPKKPKKFKQTLSARKMMATVFCDRKGVLMVEFMQQGTHNIKSVLRKTKNLCRAIQNKRRAMLTLGVMLLHDNARLNTTARTRAIMRN
jgi:hypothetical protein